MSVLRKRVSTAFPKLPVPPVIIKVFPAKMLIYLFVCIDLIDGLSNLSLQSLLKISLV